MGHLFRAFKPLLSDFLSTIVFIAVSAATGDVRLAVLVAMAVGVIQIAAIFARGRRPQTMQWASMALVVVLGALSLWTANPEFVMLKPSIGGAAIGCVMLQRGWQLRYLPPIVTQNVSQATLVVWGYVWSLLIFALAGANLYVALVLGQKIWLWYTAFVPLGVQFLAFVLQYAWLRGAVRRSLRTQAA
ncbi:MAG TPA: septation protein IspZ [Rhizomicrobium sp.]|nr:septation protein IspZ [Rhizomicrobium sp.]